MAVSLRSDGLNGMYQKGSIPPVGGFTRSHNLPGGTYSYLSDSGTVNPNVAGTASDNPYYIDGIAFRVDTQSSTVGIDTEGLRGITRSYTPIRIGGYYLGSFNKSSKEFPGSYVRAYNTSSYYVSSYVNYGAWPTDGINGSGTAYRYA